MEENVDDGGRWDTVITAKKRVFDLRLRELWHYRDLIVLFIRRDFTVAYKQTILGPLWYVLQPVFSSIVYMFVFGNLAGIGTDGIPYLLFYYGGTMLWSYFSSSLTTASAVFSNNAGIFGKVYFPRLTVPIADTVGGVIKLGIQLVLLVALYVYFVATGSAVRPSWWIVLLPCLVVWVGVLGCSIGLVVSSLTTKYRDLNHLLGFGMQLAMYATPVVYPLSQTPQGFAWVFYVNPMSAPMELFRMWAYRAGSVPPAMVVASLATTAVLALLALVLFNRNERTFVDVI